MKGGGRQSTGFHPSRGSASPDRHHSRHSRYDSLTASSRYRCILPAGGDLQFANLEINTKRGQKPQRPGEQGPEPSPPAAAVTTCPLALTFPGVWQGRSLSGWCPRGLEELGSGGDLGPGWVRAGAPRHQLGPEQARGECRHAGVSRIGPAGGWGQMPPGVTAQGPAQGFASSGQSQPKELGSSLHPPVLPGLALATCKANSFYTVASQHTSLNILTLFFDLSLLCPKISPCMKMSQP